MTSHRVIRVDEAGQLRQAACRGAGVDLLDEATWRQHGADAHFAVVDDGHMMLARCSLWWTGTPPCVHKGVDHRVGVIGHYAAAAEPAARMLLVHACDELASHGCTLAVGPMDGNTWRRYRFVTQRGAEPAFFMEPDHPDDWPGHWTGAGFEVLAEYTSARVDDLTRRDERMTRVERRLREAGVTIRPIDPERFDDELRRIYALSLVAFRQNLLYTPIAEAEFMAQYSRVRQFVQPRLVLLAEHGDRLAGYVFALPYLNRAKRGQPADTVIVKTVAVLAGRAYAGLGALLVGKVHEAAHALGFRRAIHALMHESNRSMGISARYGQTMRRYALYGKVLG